MTTSNWIKAAVSATLIAFAIYFWMNQSKSTITTQLKNFAVEDTASITKIFLADKRDNTILLERESNNSWKVNKKYVARQDVVNNLLSTINTVTLRSPVSKAMFENVVKRMAGESIKVEIYQNDSKLPQKVYYVGGSNSDHTGSFMLMENSSIPFVMHIEGHYGYLGSRYTTREYDWRSHILWDFPNEKIKTVKSIKLENKKEPTKSFEIVKIGENQYDVLNYLGQTLNDVSQEKLLYYIKLYQSISYEGYVENKGPEFQDSIRTNMPINEIYTVTDDEDRVISIATYNIPMPLGSADFDGNPIPYDTDRMYGITNDDLFVILQYYVFDPLYVSIDFFKEES